MRGIAATHRKLIGLGGGLASIVLITAVCYAIGGIPITIPALLLLVPIGIAGVTGGVFIAVVVAVVAALGYALAFLPPIGHIRIGLTEDVVVLVTFIAVAIGVAILSDRRRDRSELLDDERAILLRSVSHDLRSPLTTIRSVSSDLLVEQQYDSTTRSELLSMVVDESDRLDRIVGNLLSASRIQAGAFEPDQEAHDLGELVATCCRRFNRIDGHQAAVRCDIEPDQLMVFVDPIQLDQALCNLVENSLRAAPQDTPVVISARRIGDRSIEVCVADEGPGFARDELDHVFEPFWSGSSSTGLGLTVCKSIVEAHGGTIHARNRVDGRPRLTATLWAADVATHDGAPKRPSHIHEAIPGHVSKRRLPIVVTSGPDHRQEHTMGLIHIDLFTTLDGVAQAPGGPEEDTEGGFAFGGWQAPFDDDVVGEQIVAGMEGLDALLLGRRTYDIFAAFWPEQEQGVDAGIAQLFNAVPKYVASRASRTLDWANSTLLDADIAAGVAELRERHANVHVIGSVNFVQTLISEGLFDRLTLWIYPILLGSGKQVFAGGTVPSTLTLIEPAITSPQGVVRLSYALAGGVPSTGDMAHPDRTSAPRTDA